MIAKRPAPVTGNLSNSSKSIIKGEFTISPRSPLEFKILSPRGPKKYDQHGIGLGIVAALEKSIDGGHSIPANNSLFSRNLNRSIPIPVKSPVNSKLKNLNYDDEEMKSLENYTLVTWHGPEKKSSSKVYYDGGFQHSRRVNQRGDLDWKSRKRNQPSLFAVSPAKFGEVPAIPASDFLSSCHLCHKKMHGKDIYMYRGEKAFCSTECRYIQIVTDEKKEKYSCEFESRLGEAEVSCTPYKDEPMFSPGILAI